MRETDAATRRVTVATALAILLALAVPAAAAAAAPEPDADALAELRRMTDYMQGLGRFSVQGEGVLEVVLLSGQKIQTDLDVAMTVERPNKLRASRRGEMGDQVFYYDGKTLTLASHEHGVYAVAAAPATLEGMLDFARDQLDIVAPAADLIYRDAFRQLTDGMTAGFVVSRHALLQGQPCTQLAFRKPGVDIQVWVARGERPLPLKYVLTTTDVAASPQYSLTLSAWNTSPAVAPVLFEFLPPPGAKRVDFLASGLTAGATRVR